MEHDADDPTPALARGLDLLQRLSRDGPASLEMLARASAWPKSSVFRLLGTLERCGVVARDPADKRFRAAMRLVPALPVEERGRALVLRAMRGLCARAGQTAELFAFSGGALTMVDRCEPEEGEVRIRARIGWRTDLNEALALTLAVLAWGLPEPEWPRGGFWHWSAGRRAPLSRAEMARWAARVRRAGLAVCRAPNLNGVRRYALPVLDTDGALWGVLALASTLPDPRGIHHARFLELMARTAQELQPALPSATTSPKEDRSCA